MMHTLIFYHTDSGLEWYVFETYYANRIMPLVKTSKKLPRKSYQLLVHEGFLNVTTPGEGWTREAIFTAATNNVTIISEEDMQQPI